MNRFCSCFKQNIKQHAYCVCRFRNDPVCSSQSSEIPDCSVHTGKQDRIAEQNLQSDNHVEAVNPDFCTGFLFFSPAGLQLFLCGQASHDCKPLALRKQEMVSHKGRCRLQVIPFIYQIIDVTGSNPHCFQC
jgi:hypothetical protein